MTSKGKAKPTYQVAECEVCNWWDDKLGCFNDEYDCLFKKPIPKWGGG